MSLQIFYFLLLISLIQLSFIFLSNECAIKKYDKSEIVSTRESINMHLEIGKKFAENKEKIVRNFEYLADKNSRCEKEKEFYFETIFEIYKAKKEGNYEKIDEILNRFFGVQEDVFGKKFIENEQ